jgi:uncharacterized protein (TIGR02118 family)
MIRLSVMYPQTSSSSFDWNYYTTTHFDLVRKYLGGKGLIRTEVDKGMAGFPPGTPAPYHAIGHLFFGSIGDLVNALSTSPELIADQKNYFSGDSVVQISEVLEVQRT